MSKKRKAALICLTILILIRILYICVGGEVDRNHYKSSVIDLTDCRIYPCVHLTETFISQTDRLYGINLILTGIADDSVGNIVIQISSENNVVYQTNIALSSIENGEWKYVYINAGLEDGKEYVLHLTFSDDCVQIPNVVAVPKEKAASEVLEFCSEDQQIEDQLAVEYEYLQQPTIAERLIISSVWVLILLIVYTVFYYFDRISELFHQLVRFLCMQICADVLLVLMELSGCMIILNCSGMGFENPTKILFYIISLCAAIKMKEKRAYVCKMADTPSKCLLLNLLYIYAGFALVGQRILIYPLTLKIQAAGMFVFAVAVLWFVPVIQTLLCMTDWFSTAVFSPQKALNQGRFIGLVLCLLFVPAIYHLYACNPGISSPDTEYCMITQAHNLHGMSDWHPAFYGIILSIILRVWDSTYAVIIVQYFFWGYVFVELFLYLRKKGMKDSVLFLAALFMGINAGNFVHLNTIWKDIPYAVSLLWTLVLLAKLSFDFEEYQQKWYIYLELIIALTGIFFYRKNGIVPFVLIAAAMIVVLRKNIKIWFTLLITTALICTVKGPVYNYFEVQDIGKYGMYIGLGQDILGVYYAGGEISDETLSMISVMTSYNTSEYHYTPTWSRQSYELNVEPKEFIVSYINTFIKNPILMIRAVIAREDAIWNLYAGADTILGCVNYNGTMDGSNWNDYYPRRDYNGLYSTMTAMTGYTTTQWIAAIEWRCGIFTLLGMTAFLYAYMRFDIKKYILIAAPVIGQIVGLMLSTGWSDFRYFWPLNLMNFAGILLILSYNSAQESHCATKP